MTTLPTLPPFLQTLLLTSAYASLFALIILLLQPLLHRTLSARWRFLLWMLVLIRFLPLPLPQSRLSIFNLLPHSPTLATLQPSPQILTPTILPPTTLQLPITIYQLPAPNNQSPTPPTKPLLPSSHPTPFPYLTLLYLTGATLLLLRLLLASLSLQKILRHSTPITAPSLLATLRSAQLSLALHKTLPLLQTESLSSPALVGLFRPKLLLPSHLLSTLTPDEFHQIFLHELAHLRRRDIALNYFFSALTLLHWFNPLLWFILPRIKADRELACDELVLHHTSDPSSYGHTLLKIFQSTTRPTPTLALGIIDTKPFFKRRIHMIAQFKKRPAWLALPAAAALLIITACTLTTAQTTAQTPTPAPATQTKTLTRADHTEAQSTYNLTTPSGISGTRTLTHAALRSTNNDPLSALTLPEISCDKIPLNDVIAYLHDRSGLNIILDAKALETAGIDQHTPVTLHLDNVPFPKVLSILFVQISPHLAWSFDDNVLTITTRADLATHTRTEIYNVRDLLDATAQVPANGNANPPITPADPPQSSQEQQEQHDTFTLIQIIESTCDSPTWKDQGGDIGSIVPFKGLFTITTTPEIHQKVQHILDTLRAADKQSTP